MSRIIQNNNKQNNKINTISIQTVKKNEKKTSSSGIYIYHNGNYLLFENRKSQSFKM